MSAFLTWAGGKLGGMLGGWFGIGKRVELAIDDDLMFEFSVNPSLLAPAVYGDLARVYTLLATEEPLHPDRMRVPPDWVVASLKDNVVRCKCNSPLHSEGRAWRLVGNAPMSIMGPRGADGQQIAAKATKPVAPGRTDAGLVRRSLCVGDVIMAALPFLCPTGFPMHPKSEQARDLSGMPPAQADYFRKRRRGQTTIARMSIWGYGANATLPPICEHVPGLMAGQLGQSKKLGDSRVYVAGGKREDRIDQRPVRCLICHADVPNGINPQFWEDRTARCHGRMLEKTVCVALTFRAWITLLTPRAGVAITWWWPELCDSPEKAPSGARLTFCVVSCGLDAEVVEEAGLIPLILDGVAGHPRALKLQALYIANTAPVGWPILLTEPFHRGLGVLPPQRTQTHTFEYVAERLDTVSFNNAVLIAGSSYMPLDAPLSWALTLQDVIGVPEGIVDQFVPSALVATSSLASATIEWTFGEFVVRRSPLNIVGTAEPRRTWRALDVGRLASLLTFRRAQRFMSGMKEHVSLLAAMNLPLPPRRNGLDMPIVSAPTTVGRPRAEMAHLMDAVNARLGRISWFTMGSRGDHVPVLALARHMYSIGFDIEVVRAHTEDEGNQLLHFVESGRLWAGAPIFAKVWMAAASTANLKFGPPELPDLTAGVSLRPPPSIARPADFGAGAFVNWAIDVLLRDKRNVFNIGAYPGLSWMPRSANGTTFLVQSRKPRAGRKVKILIVTGSSSVAPPHIRGAVLIQPGDHYAQMEGAEIVVCHGGAGTVQTAAAAGCTVYVYDLKLDRWYFVPHNAGAGVKCGADPDKIVLPLAEADPIIWLLYWKMGWFMFAKALYWVLKRRGSTLVWLVVIALIRLWNDPTTTIAAGSPINALAAGFLANFVPSYLAVWSAPFVLEWALFLVTWTGRPYYELAFEAGLVVLRLTSSSAFWMTYAYRDSFFLACLVGGWGLALRPFRPLLSAGMAMLTTDQDDQSALMCVSLAYPDLYLPVLHIRFSNRTHTRRWEGIWGTAVGGMWQPYTVVASDWKFNGSREWEIPTRVPWAHFEALPAMTAPYSPLWNCQSSAIVAVWAMWGALGLGGFLILPSMALATLAWIVAVLCVAIGLACLHVVPVVVPILEIAGLGGRVSELREQFGIAAERLLASDQPLSARLMHALVGVTTGWGANRLDGIGPLFRRLAMLAAEMPAGEARDAAIDNALEEYPYFTGSTSISNLIRGFYDI
jgi:hypothetical protein